MLRKLARRPKVPDSLLDQAADLTQLEKDNLNKILRPFFRNDDSGPVDIYLVFLEARQSRLYEGTPGNRELIAHLRCLTHVDQETAQRFLSQTAPPGNILHAIERLIQDTEISQEMGKCVMLQFLLGCSRDLAHRHSQHSSILEMVTAALQAGDISESEATIARHAYCLLLDPEVVKWICTRDNISEMQEDELYHAAQEGYNADLHIAQMRHWRMIPRDELQEIFERGYGNNLREAKDEYLAQQLMKNYPVDHAHAASEITRCNGDLEMASAACAEHAKSARARLSISPAIPTRDTRSPPDVGPNTRVIALLGVDETESASYSASPSIGDGWMVSDFYLWMHVLRGMGKSQQWITSMPPEYLLDKYGRENLTRMMVTHEEPSKKKPLQVKWQSGFVHGDAFEERRVVLDDDLLPFVTGQVTIGPHGPQLRDYFLKQLERTVASAAEPGDRILILIFAHGDYESNGGLVIGLQENDEFPSDKLLQPHRISSILSAHPNVNVTMFMTSCYSGHWVETTEFRARSQAPVILVAAEHDQDSFGFAWSQSQRHAGGLFSSATVAELLKEPSSLPPDAGEDTSRKYGEMTTALVAEMHRLCLPANIKAGYGSSPVFTDPASQEKFWRRTGYRLHDYKRNWESLRVIPASDPHPKRDRKKFTAEFVDESDPDIRAWRERHPGILDEDYPEATGGYGGTARGLVAQLNIQYLIILYSRSKPMTQTHEHSLITQAVCQYYDGNLDFQRKLKLRRVLMTRLEMNKKVNIYVRVLGLYRLPNIEEWLPEHTSEEYSAKKLSYFARRIVDSHLLSAPSDGRFRFHYYRKPSLYLAAAMLLAGYDERDLDRSIDSLWKMRRENKLMDSITRSYMKTERCTQTVSSARDLMQNSWKISRSSSKHQRRPLSDVCWET